MALIASPKSWPYNNNCSSPKGPESWNLKKLWGNDMILDLVNMCYRFYKQREAKGGFLQDPFIELLLT